MQAALIFDPIFTSLSNDVQTVFFPLPYTDLHVTILTLSL